MNGDVGASIVACQTMAATAYFMSTLNSHVKDKQVENTVWWQDRSAYWSGVARRCLIRQLE